MFHVLAKPGPDGLRPTVPFTLNPMQRRLDAALTGRDIGAKARQLGFSTYVIARYLAKCITLENRRCVLISHEEEATKRLLATAQFMLDNLRSGRADVEVVADISRATQANITFRSTNSWFYIGTAGAKAFGRGDTITDLHCSEYAWWPDPAKLLTGLMGSVPDSGEVIIESTGNGIGNDFEQRATKASQGHGKWRLHFLPWNEAEEYEVVISAAEGRQVMAGLSKEEEILVRDFRLTPGQIVWRRNKLDDFGDDVVMFKQEFPITLDECFQSQGGAIFKSIAYHPTASWKETQFPGGGEAYLEGHPKQNLTYVLGGDPSAGVKLSESDPYDNSVLQVLCVETAEQVGRWHSGRIEPDKFGDKTAYEIGRRFNDALIVIESNNHGLTSLAALRKTDYPGYKIFKRKSPNPNHPERGIVDWGYATTTKTKPLAVGRLRAMLSDGMLIHDMLTYRELLAFIETEGGTLEAREGAHDDFVMALVMAIAGWRKASFEAAGKVDEDVARTEREQELLRNRGRTMISTDHLFERKHHPHIDAMRPKQRDANTFLGGSLL